MYNQIEEQALNELYETLELSNKSSLNEVKKAHRKLAKKYHPDLNNDSEESNRKMSQINNAYNTLMNQNKLKEYLANYVKTHNTTESSDAIETKDAESNEYITVEQNEKCSWKDANYELIIPPYETLEEFIEYLKEIFYEAYKKAKYEEKSYTLKMRQQDIYELFSKYNYCEKINSKLIKKGIKLITFSSMELFYQLGKLKKQVGDTIPQYVMRNRKTLAGLLIFSTLINPVSANSSNEVQTLSQENISSSDMQKPNMLLESTYRLTRLYTVKAGDNISKISSHFNIPIKQLIESNNLKSLELSEEQILEIPYYVDRSELSYYTTNVNTDEYEKLEDLAEAYNTDIKTIYSINTEAFAEIDGKYMQISNELLVPTFPTSKEVQEQKAKYSYQKTSNLN